jgi:glutaredoxin-related protein
MPVGLLYSSNGGVNSEWGTEVGEKMKAYFQDTLETVKERYAIFNKARSEDGYTFKQSTAIAIAGEYDVAQVRQGINDIVESNPFVLFTWDASPSCKQAIKALESMGDAVTMKIVRLDDPWEEGNPIRAELGKMTGKSSVPSVWIAGEYVGGYDSGVSDDAPGLVTMAFRGTLIPKLESAGALVRPQ